MEKLHADIANVQDAIAKLKQDKVNANELTGNTLLEDIRKVDDAVEAIPATLPKVSDDNKKFDELITAATTELGRQIEAEQALIARIGKTDLTDPQRVVITQAMEKLHADIANVQDAIAKLKQDKINANELTGNTLLEDIRKVDDAVEAIPATLPKVSDDNKIFDTLITAATTELGRQIEAEQALIARISKTDLTDPQRVVITQAMEKLHADIANVQDAIAKLKQDKVNANELTGNTLLEDIRKVDDAVEAIPATLPKVSDDNKIFDTLITAATTELGRQIEAEQALIARISKTDLTDPQRVVITQANGEAARRYRKRARRYR